MPDDTASIARASATAEQSSCDFTNALSLPRCPICRARLLGETTCPRCGSDISRPMLIAGKANDLERMAVAHLLGGEWVLAKAALVDVQRLRSSELSTQMLAFVEHQLIQSTGSPEKHSFNVEHVVADGTLSTLDLSIVERYG